VCKAASSPGSILLCLILSGLFTAIWAADWPPVSREELAMTDDPANPGASAILLYREVGTDHVKGSGSEYRRIKVLNDDGKKYGDIEIPYIPGAFQIDGIQARTIRPDGTTVNFQGQIFDRTALRARKIKIQVKALTLPEVEKGGIIEYSYNIRSRRKAPDVLKHPFDYMIPRTVVVPLETWLVQEDLFTKRARFTVRPLSGANLNWFQKNVPNDRKPERLPDGSVLFQVENVPAYQREEHMPPDDAVRGRIDLFYQVGPLISADYWQRVGQERAEDLRSFLTEPKRLQQFLTGIIAASDSPDTQLRKIYSRVQQIRSLSDEPAKTEQETKRENLKEGKNVEDILKRNYARGNEVNLAFAALARAAGFESAPILVKSRASGLFEPNSPDPTQLDAMVVWVRAGGQSYLLDPARRYCPFGLLPWEETATTGIIVDDGSGLSLKKDAVPSFIGTVTTSAPISGMALIERRAILHLDAEGTVEGKVSVNYTGYEALERRSATGNSDDTARKKLLEDELKEWIPGATDVHLDGTLNWEQFEEPLHASFTVKFPGYASPAGRRLLFRVGFFGGSAQSFKSDKRIHDVQFPHPFEELDDVTWNLPLGYRVGSLPEKQSESTIFGKYTLSTDASGAAVRSQRHFTIQALLVPQNYYAALRSYFTLVRLHDDSQIVLEPGSEQNASKPN